MDLSMGNKNVVLGLIVIMLYLSMTFFIERTSTLHGFHSKAAAAVSLARSAARSATMARVSRWQYFRRAVLSRVLSVSSLTSKIIR